MPHFSQFNFPFDEDGTTLQGRFSGKAVYDKLGEQFTPEEVTGALLSMGMRSNPAKLTSEWVRTKRVVPNARYGATLFTKVA